MATDLTGLDLQDCLRKWSEVTALSLGLLEAALQKDFPDLTGEDLRQKVIERLNTHRSLRLTEQ